MQGDEQHSFPHKSLLKSVEHLIIVNFIYQYLLDVNLFGLLLRSAAHSFVAQVSIVKQLKICVYFIMTTNFLFVLRHTAIPQGHPVFIDFVEQTTPSRLHLILLDIMLCATQLFRVLVVWTMKEASFGNTGDAAVVLMPQATISVIPGLPHMQFPWFRTPGRRSLLSTRRSRSRNRNRGNEAIPGAIPLRSMSGRTSLSAGSMLQQATRRHSFLPSSISRPIIANSTAATSLSLSSTPSVVSVNADRIHDDINNGNVEEAEEIESQQEQSRVNNFLAITPLMELNLAGLIHTFLARDEHPPAAQSNSYNLPV